MIVIPDLFKEVVDTVSKQYDSSVYYFFGNPIEIDNRLIAMSKARKKAFPAVFLFLDVEENRNVNGYWGTISPTLAIVNFTKETYLAEQRKEKVFKPILYPIYEQFMKALDNHRAVQSEFISHVKRDHYFYGSNLNEGVSEFSERLDAITIDINDLLIQDNC